VSVFSQLNVTYCLQFVKLYLLDIYWRRRADIKGTTPPFVRSPVVDEETMRPDWIGVSALFFLHCSEICWLGDRISGQGNRGNRLTPVHMIIKS